MYVKADGSGKAQDRICCSIEYSRIRTIFCTIKSVFLCRIFVWPCHWPENSYWIQFPWLCIMPLLCICVCVCVCVCDFLRERKISFHFLSCNGQTCFKFQWLKAKLDQPEYYNKMNENLSSWKDTIVKYVCFILQIYFSYLLKMNYSIYDCTIYVSIWMHIKWKQIYAIFIYIYHLSEILNIHCL